MNGCFSNAPFSLKHKIKRQALDDNILLLSEYEDFEHYLNSLGKKTRQHLRYYRRKFDAYVQSNKIIFGKKVLMPTDDPKLWVTICEKNYELNEQRCNSKGFIVVQEKSGFLFAIR